MHTNQPAVDETPEVNEAALGAARTLAEAIGDSEIFTRFEAAQDAFQADEAARTRLDAYQVRQQELRVSAMWGGAGREEQLALEREWLELSRLPTLQAYLQAQEVLQALFRDVAGRITSEIGVDYGAACAPTGGCC